jgi:hypothetical protein
MKQTLYAFWTHDQFPFVLGGTVTKVHDNGKVETEEFGRGFRFTPLKIVPLKAGLIIKQDLEQRRAAYRQKMADIQNEAVADLKKHWCFIK